MLVEKPKIKLFVSRLKIILKMHKESKNYQCRTSRNCRDLEIQNIKSQELCMDYRKGTDNKVLKGNLSTTPSTNCSLKLHLKCYPKITQAPELNKISDFKVFN